MVDGLILDSEPVQRHLLKSPNANTVIMNIQTISYH